MSWRHCTNQAVGSAAISDINIYLASGTWPSEAPIDRFYTATRQILAAAVPSNLTPHPVLGPLLLVGVVSATENYFRDMISALVRICPIAQASSADQSINLGSVVWHCQKEFQRGALEHFSFADKETIRKASKNFLKHELKASGPTGAILDEFDRICELRHGIVHSSGILAGKNAIKLNVGRTNGRVSIVPGFAQLQEATLVCTTLVATFNTELFEVMARRWAVEWRRTPAWNPSRQEQLFRAIWNIFHSRIDAQSRRIAKRLTLKSCKEEISKEFNLI